MIDIVRRISFQAALMVNAIYKPVLLFVLLLSLLSAVTPLDAQTSAGALVGSVVDPSGLPVRNATVTVQNLATGETSTVITTGAGEFRFNELKPGTYSATTSATGFKSSRSEGITVNISLTTALNVHLELGNTEETITVSATAAVLQTESSDIGTSVGSKLVNDLPLSVGSGEMRSIVDFIFLVPGVAGGENLNKLAGGQATGSQVQVDGGSVDTISGANFDVAGYTPSVDAVQELTILQSGLPAQYGRTTGGLTNFATISGTNEYHGQIYDIFRNTALDANTWFNNAFLATDPRNKAYARPKDNKNEYGLTFGGPIVIPKIYDGHNRTFGFLSWEQYRQGFGYTIISTIPTVANRNGDFSSTLTTDTVVGTNLCTGQPIYQGEIFDPSTTQQVGTMYCRQPFNFGGQLNHIDPARFSTVAKNALSYFPQPTSSGQTNNYAFPNSRKIVITAQTIRIDHSFNKNNKIFGSYNPHESTTDCNGPKQIPGPGNGTTCFVQDGFLHDFHVGYDHTFSESAFNHFVVSGFRYTNFAQSPASLAGTNYNALLGIRNIGGPLFPSFNFGEGIDSLGNFFYVKDYQNHIQVNDSVILSKGHHTFTMGAEGRFLQFTRINLIQSSGNYNFSRSETAGTNLITTESGNGFASFLIGAVGSANASLPTSYPRWNQWYGAVFLQDDFKITPTLTLNLGLRYEAEVPPKEARDNTDIFSPTLANVSAGGRPGALLFSGNGAGRSGLSSRWANTYYKNIGPRLGFAWSPSALAGQTVFRGNWGILYGALPMTNIAISYPGFTAQPSFTDTFTLGGFTPPFALDNAFPAFSVAPNLNPDQLNGTGTAPYYTARSYGRPAMVQSYGLEVQQQFPHSVLLSLSYNGSRSTHLSSSLVCMNCLAQQYYGLGPLLSQSFSSAQTTIGSYQSPYPGFTGTLAQGLQPFPQFASIATALENLGQSSYNALYAKVQRRFENGLSLLLSYTWSKTLTDADSTLTGFYAVTPQNPFNFRGEKSISALDYPNVFSASYIYELPIGKGKMLLNHGGPINAVLGGWEFGGIHHLQSGNPASFGCATGLPGNSPCFRFSLVSTGSPLSAAVQRGNFNPLTDVYFNPAAFLDPNANSRIQAGGGYQYGTLPRYIGTIRFPVSPNSDFSLIKRITMVRESALEFRAELFNAFNQHRFATPNTAPNQPGFGQVSSTQNSPRQGQLTLRVLF